MHGYEATAEAMENVACIIEQARRDGRDPSTALQITLVTLNYVAGRAPTLGQQRTLAALHTSLRERRRTGRA
ncbi:hypothetical protein [Methylobacterium nigriterrae]|uniref:hypothetical protein n=1 Tax=Methylobacterium nigriterrae TaxID=3127512 RepID=UPI003013F55D